MNSHLLDPIQSYRPTITIHPTPLAAKVAAWNECHSFIREHVPQALNLALAFMGEKIILSGGGFTKKFRDAIPDIFNQNIIGRRVWLRSTVYNLILEVSIDGHFQKGTGPGGYTSSHRAERSVYLADLQGGHTITKLYPFKAEDWRVDYTEEGVVLARAAVDKAEAALSAANAALAPFGQWD